MSTSPLIQPQSDSDLEALRQEHYNASIIQLDFIHEMLMRVRVQADDGRLTYSPGQYTILALGGWERRMYGPSRIAEEALSRRLIKRAYSISCPLLDAQGTLAPCDSYPYLEFYITLVPRSDEEIPKRPPLTPRLFALREGDRLHMSHHIVGHYTLDPVQPEDDVIFVATGTGEAPHNAMAAELLGRNHQGRIASLTCVRERSDAGYLKEQHILSETYSNYQYHVYTTREPENLDPAHPGYVGKQYIQDVFGSHQFEADFGWRPDPQRTHVFLCGNPDMIGVPQRLADGTHEFPEKKGMIELLVGQGFQLQHAHTPGNIHFEKYW